MTVRTGVLNQSGVGMGFCVGECDIGRLKPLCVVLEDSIDFGNGWQGDLQLFWGSPIQNRGRYLFGCHEVGRTLVGWRDVWVNVSE